MYLFQNKLRKNEFFFWYAYINKNNNFHDLKDSIRKYYIID